MYVTPAHVRPAYADSEEDINSELDELDREEFYRLKKVTKRYPVVCHRLTMLVSGQKQQATRQRDCGEG